MDDVPRNATPIVGRDRELADLLTLADAAARGEPAAAVLAGDAGVGKSRLIAELVARLVTSGTHVLVGHCVNLPDGGLPYLPFVDAFRALDTDAWHRLEPHLRGGAPGPLGQLELYEAVADLLFDLAEQRPVCFVVEDLHWADGASKDLLRYLLGRLEGQRLSLVLTYRSDDLHRRHPLRSFLAELARVPVVRRMTLNPLPPGDIAELVSAEGPLDPAVLEDVVARAEGNAFFAEELGAAQRACRGSVALPDALLDVLIARLEQLDPAAARVVGVAAVAGRRVSHDLLAAVTGLPDADLDEALRAAVARNVLVPDGETGGYEFRHALLQEAAYTDLLPGERVRLHREYTRALSPRLTDSPFIAAELAHHAELSHDLPLAVHASVLAARHAMSVHAPADAQRHFERALAWWSGVPDAAQRAGCCETELYLAAAEAAAAAGDPGRSAALLQAADDLLRSDDDTDPQQRVLVRAKLAAARYHAGDDRDEQTSAEAVAMAQGLPPGPARAQARSTHAVILFAHDRPDACAIARLALADAQAIGAANIQAQALVTLARAAQQAGDLPTATEYFTRALPLARESSDVATELRTLFNLAWSRYDAGDLTQALHFTEQGTRRASETGMTYADYARPTIGIDLSARYALGQWDVDPQPPTAAVALPATVRPMIAVFQLNVAVNRGSPDIDERLARVRVLRLPDPLARSQLAALVANCEVDHLLWLHDQARALRVYRTAVEVPLKQWEADVTTRLSLDALALAALADLAAAARTRDDAAATAAAVDQGDAILADARAAVLARPAHGERVSAEERAWLARAEAEWSRLQGPGRVPTWGDAVAAFDYGYRYELARSRYRLAEALLERAAGQPAGGDGGDGDKGGGPDDGGAPRGADGHRDDAAEAADLLRRAHQEATALRAAPLADAVVALARRAKVTGVGRPVTVTVLTTREQEVLALLARGHTNRQLGKELFISEKTASVHVSNILAKLGAGTRGEAVAIAQHRGLI